MSWVTQVSALRVIAAVLFQRWARSSVFIGEIWKGRPFRLMFLLRGYSSAFSELLTWACLRWPRFLWLIISLSCFLVRTVMTCLFFVFTLNVNLTLTNNKARLWCHFTEWFLKLTLLACFLGCFFFFSKFFFSIIREFWPCTVYL